MADLNPEQGFFILIKMEEFVLPPHIENRNGSYFNTVSGRWIGFYKIKEVCERYWFDIANKEAVDLGDGILKYQANFVEPVGKKKTKEKKVSEIIIVPLANIIEINETQNNHEIINEETENKILDEHKDESITTTGKIEEPIVVTEPILRTIRKKRKPRTKTVSASCTPAKFDQYLEDLAVEVGVDLNKEKVVDVVLIQEKEEPIEDNSIQTEFNVSSVDDFKFNNSTFNKSDYYEEEALVDIIVKYLKAYDVDFQTIYDGVVKEKHKQYGMYYEEFMAAVVSAVYLNCPFADRIDFVSSVVNRDSDQIRALLGIHNIIYNFLSDDSSHYGDVFWSLSFDCSRHFARYYPINYHYNYRNLNKEDWI